MIALLLNRYLIGAVVSIGVVYFAFSTGRNYGVAECRQQAVEATQKQIRERGKTDAAINKMDAGGICVAIGGVFTNGKCE